MERGPMSSFHFLLERWTTVERIIDVRMQDCAPEGEWVPGSVEYHTSHGSVSLPLLFLLSDRSIPEVEAVGTLHSIKLKECSDGNWCTEYSVEESREKVTLPLEKDSVWSFLKAHQIPGIEFTD